MPTHIVAIGKTASYKTIKEFVENGDYDEHDSVTLCLQRGAHCLEDCINLPRLKLTISTEELCAPTPQDPCSCDNSVSTELDIPTHVGMYGYRFVHHGGKFDERVARFETNHGLTYNGTGEYSFEYIENCNCCIDRIKVCSTTSGPNFRALTPELTRYGKVKAMFYHAESGTSHKFNIIGTENGNEILISNFPDCVKCPVKGDAFVIMSSTSLTVAGGSEIQLMVNELVVEGVQLRGKGDLVVTSDLYEMRYTTSHSIRYTIVGGMFKLPRHDAFFNSKVDLVGVGAATTFYMACFGKCAGIDNEGSKLTQFGSVYDGNEISIETQSGGNTNLFLSEVFNCILGPKSVAGGITNAKVVELYNNQVGMLALENGGIDSSPSVLDRLMKKNANCEDENDGEVLYFENNSVAIRIEQNSFNKHADLYLLNNNTDLQIDTSVYPAINAYVSGTEESMGSKLVYSVYP